MFRARRYRIILIFTTVFILAVFYFTRSRDLAVSSNTPPIVDRPEPFPHNPPAAGSKENITPPSHDTPVNPPPADQQSGSPKNRPGNEQAPVHDPAASQKPTIPASDQVKEGTKGGSLEKTPSEIDAESGSGGQAVLPGAEEQSHWEKLPEQFPLAPADIIKLPTGNAKTLPKLQAKIKDESSGDKLQRLQKLASIKQSFEHAWGAYKASAMGHDELNPTQGGYRDPFNGWGATLVDGLDTLWIMELKEEFSMAVDQVKKIDFTTSIRKDIPVFETVIRYLGGLLGAYDISGHKYDVLLDKAVELADILIGVFDTPNRMPMLYYKWAPQYVSQPHTADKIAILAEIGSLSLEFTRLAQLTRQDKYYDAIARITNELEKFQTETIIPGLWPLEVDASGCDQHQPRASSEPAYSATPSPANADSYRSFLQRRGRGGGLSEDAQPANYDNLAEEGTGANTSPDGENCNGGLKKLRSKAPKFGMGALADSTYEYLPKEYMLLGGLNEQYRTMYENSMDAARKHLLFRPMIQDDRDIRFLSNVRPLALNSAPDAYTMRYDYEGSHLVCFAGGMFAVGAKIFGIEGDLDIASKLTDGCVWAYESTTTGIMPESFTLMPCKNGEPCTWNETEYRRALDPYENDRFAGAERLAEMKIGSSKTQNRERDPGSGWHVIATPSPSPAPAPGANGNDITDRSTNLPVKPSSLSHEDFVNARIRDQRLPPGMVSITQRKYLLRPEAIESVFIMFRLTGDDYWRQKGWKMFEAVSKYTQTELAHSSIDDVTSETPRLLAKMESFWLAETLKYFYLLFSDPSVVNLDEYVLNTEAHPFRRPGY
ncbi:hypothetical protein ASPWEDRAFT_101200 [Aspergillus wentii DTO 134E9]|uniref:alpha-1,2-Mannosidase n=1 Tax=Aspergillus wentii DTO 134E9 TaxID=1073089 RepID=A0A1L9RZF5_ASPWE|nr:uncharacterized protein ASPWEDRAFT_101200 [Aspergillus wentii DTO 134E9]OJJ40350.1 hypothetical protein ASPWEDRAFT_101200 [Aspergillus wentii DTO 134E9]